MNTWDDFINNEMKKDYFKFLSKKLKDDENNNIIYPPKEDIFNAFKYCSLDNVKVVILGQCPYHGKDEAHGLSFSVQKGIKIPPSLKNIFKEIKNDLNIEPPNHGCLIDWANQGVLLLNSALTVKKHMPGSHIEIWKEFTDNAIKLINDQNRAIVYMLWGNFSKNKKPLITNKKHFVLESAHPSPFSANNGFFDCKHFSKANDFLIKNNIEPINWKIE